MVDYKLIFYTSVPLFLLSAAYIFFGWAGLFECTDLIVIIFIVFVLSSVLSEKNE